MNTFNPATPPIDEPPARQEPVIDEPGRVIPAIDPHLPGTPREIREPRPSPEDEPPA